MYCRRGQAIDIPKIQELSEDHFIFRAAPYFLLLQE